MRERKREGGRYREIEGYRAREKEVGIRLQSITCEIFSWNNCCLFQIEAISIVEKEIKS